MTEPAWEIIPYAPDLAPAVVALHRRVWPDVDTGDERYVRWQYENNPAGQALSTFARAPSGELIGQFGALPVRLWVEGEEQLGALGLNVATDQAYRMQGVFAALGRAADERMASAGASIAFAMPNANSFPGFLSRLGFTHAGDVPFLVRPVNVRRIVAQRLHVPALPALAALCSRPVFRPLPRAPRSTAGDAVERVERFDERFDGFWTRMRGRQRVMVVRDVRYLEWRYLHNPIRPYQVFRATAGGSMTGYVVVRVAGILGLRAGIVVDFLADPDGAGRALLSQALAYFAGEDVDLVATLMFSHVPEYRLLRRAGLWPLPRRLHPQRFRLVARDGAPVRDARNWFFTLGDYDVV